MAWLVTWHVLFLLVMHVATLPTRNYGYGAAGDHTTTIDYDLADFDEFGFDPVTPSAVDFVGMTGASGNADSAAAESLYSGNMFDTNQDPFSTSNALVSTTTPDTTADVSVEEIDTTQDEGGPTDEGNSKRSNKSSIAVDYDTTGNDGDETLKRKTSNNQEASKGSPTENNANGTAVAAGVGGKTDASQSPVEGESQDPDNDTGMADDAEKSASENQGSSGASKPEGSGKGTYGSETTGERENKASNTPGETSARGSSQTAGGDSKGTGVTFSGSRSSSASSENSGSNSVDISSSIESGTSSDSTDQSASSGGVSSSSSESSQSSEDSGGETGDKSGDSSSSSSSSSAGSEESSSSFESQSTEERNSRSSSTEQSSGSDSDGSLASAESAQSQESGQNMNGDYDKSTSGSNSEPDTDSDEYHTLNQCFDPSASQHDLCNIVRALKMVCLIQFPADCSSQMRRKRGVSSFESRADSAASAGSSATSFKYSGPTSSSSSSSLSVSSESPEADSPFVGSTEVSGTHGSSHSRATSDMTLESISMESISASFERSNSVAEVMVVIKSLCPAICAADQSTKIADTDDDFDPDLDFDDIDSDGKDADDSNIDESHDSGENSLENYSLKSQESDESDELDEPDSVETTHDLSDEDSMSGVKDSPESLESGEGLTLGESRQSSSTETTESFSVDSGTMESGGGSSSDNTSK